MLPAGPAACSPAEPNAAEFDAPLPTEQEVFLDLQEARETPEGIPYRELGSLALFTPEVGRCAPIFCGDLPRDISSIFSTLRGKDHLLLMALLPVFLVAFFPRGCMWLMRWALDVHGHYWKQLVRIVKIIEYSFEYRYGQPADIWLRSDEAFYRITSVSSSYAELWRPVQEAATISGHVVNTLLNVRNSRSCDSTIAEVSRLARHSPLTVIKRITRHRDFVVREIKAQKNRRIKRSKLFKALATPYSWSNFCSQSRYSSPKPPLLLDETAALPNLSSYSPSSASPDSVLSSSSLSSSSSSIPLADVEPCPSPLTCEKTREPNLATPPASMIYVDIDDDDIPGSPAQWPETPKPKSCSLQDAPPDSSREDAVQSLLKALFPEDSLAKPLGRRSNNRSLLPAETLHFSLPRMLDDQFCCPLCGITLFKDGSISVVARLLSHVEALHLDQPERQSLMFTGCHEPHDFDFLQWPVHGIINKRLRARDQLLHPFYLKPVMAVNGSATLPKPSSSLVGVVPARPPSHSNVRAAAATTTAGSLSSSMIWHPRAAPAARPIARKVDQISGKTLHADVVRKNKSAERAVAKASMDGDMDAGLRNLVAARASANVIRIEEPPLPDAKSLAAEALYDSRPGMVTSKTSCEKETSADKTVVPRGGRGGGGGGGEEERPREHACSGRHVMLIDILMGALAGLNEMVLQDAIEPQPPAAIQDEVVGPNGSVDQVVVSSPNQENALTLLESLGLEPLSKEPVDPAGSAGDRGHQKPSCIIESRPAVCNSAADIRNLTNPVASSSTAAGPTSSVAQKPEGPALAVHENREKTDRRLIDFMHRAQLPKPSLTSTLVSGVKTSMMVGDGAHRVEKKSMSTCTLTPQIDNKASPCLSAAHRWIVSATSTRAAAPLSDARDPDARPRNVGISEATCQKPGSSQAKGSSAGVPTLNVQSQRLKRRRIESNIGRTDSRPLPLTESAHVSSKSKSNGYPPGKGLSISAISGHDKTAVLGTSVGASIDNVVRNSACTIINQAIITLPPLAARSGAMLTSPPLAPIADLEGSPASVGTPMGKVSQLMGRIIDIVGDTCWRCGVTLSSPAHACQRCGAVQD